MSKRTKCHLASGISIALVLMMAICIVLNEFFLVTNRMRHGNGHVKCLHVRDVIKRQRKEASSINVTMAKYDRTITELTDTTKGNDSENIFPLVTTLLEANLSTKFINRTETLFYQKSETQKPLLSLSRAQQDDAMTPLKPTTRFAKSAGNLPGSFAKDTTSDCKGMDFLLSSKDFPNIVHGKDEKVHLRRDGQIPMTVSVVNFKRTKSYRPPTTLDPMEVVINRDPRNYDRTDVQFEIAKESFYKLLRMQGWPGIPDVHVVCLLAENGTELQSLKNSHSFVHSISYIVDEYRQGIPLCRTLADDCETYGSLLTFVKSLPDPAFVALKIMRSFSFIFENFYVNGVYPAELLMDKAILTQHYDIIFTSFDHLMFMDQTSTEQMKYKRLLSDVSCRFGYQCPTRDLYGDNKSTSLCREFRGYCGSNNRCWGLDTNSHLCVLSNTLFPLLGEVVRLSKKQPSNMDTILICSGQPLPEYRCNWTAFRIAIEAMLR